MARQKREAVAESRALAFPFRVSAEGGLVDGNDRTHALAMNGASVEIMERIVQRVNATADYTEDQLQRMDSNITIKGCKNSVNNGNRIRVK